MDSNLSLSSEMTTAINIFVDRIEAILIRDAVPRSERTTICDEVESQILTMVAQRIESGSELSLELVKSIVDSMDQPESYSTSVGASTIESLEPIEMERIESPSSAPSTSEKVGDCMEGKPHASIPKMPSWRAAIGSIGRKTIGSLLQTETIVHGGLGLSMLGLLLFLLSFADRHRGGPGLLLGFAIMLVGCLLCGISYVRIRLSNGDVAGAGTIGARTTGSRRAAIGMISLPFAMANLIVISILIGTHAWILLGAACVVVLVAYANYRLWQLALKMLETPINAKSNQLNGSEVGSALGT
jgi:hypothetical protein